MRGPLGLIDSKGAALGGLPLLLGLLGLCGVAGKDAASCTCVPGPPLTSRRIVRETAATYDAVFAGVIVKVAYSRPPRIKGAFPLDEAMATVALTRRWRGRGRDTVVVRTALYTTACGLGFQQGERYLLFARKAGGSVYADKCGPSRLWDEEADRLAELLGRGESVH
jgi:hypothetical protein